MYKTYLHKYKRTDFKLIADLWAAKDNRDEGPVTCVHCLRSFCSQVCHDARDPGVSYADASVITLNKDMLMQRTCRL